MVSVAGMVLVSPLTPTNSMHNILKHLDIIKNAVAIDDKESYFEQLKSQLEEEYRCLAQDLIQLKIVMKAE